MDARMGGGGKSRRSQGNYFCYLFSMLGPFLLAPSPLLAKISAAPMNIDMGLLRTSYRYGDIVPGSRENS